MKKLFPLIALLSAMTLIGCGAKNTEASSVKEPESSVKASSSKATASSSKAVSSSADKSSAAAKSSSEAKSSTAAHSHTWTKGEVVKNSDGKDCTNYACACGDAKVTIAIGDASAGASDIGNTGKLGKGKTFTWKIVAPKAGEATLQFFVKYGQTGDSMTDSVRETIWGNSGDGQQDYSVTVGGKAATVLVNSKSYQETGVTEEGADVNFATLAVVAGENEISLTTPSDQYYRNCFVENVSLVIAK